MNNNERLSLLWPKNFERSKTNTFIKISDQTIKDLDCKLLLSNFIYKSDYKDSISKILLSLCTDINVIKYRQLILKDFFDKKELLDCFTELIPSFEALSLYSTIEKKNVTSLMDLTNRISELEIFVNTIDKLRTLKSSFKKNGVAGFFSEFFSDFFSEVDRISEKDDYKNLKVALPELRGKIQSISSITVGVNLTSNLQPAEATLLSVNSERYTGKKGDLLSKLFKKDEYCGIAPLHHPPLKKENTAFMAGATLDPLIYGYAVEPILTPIGKDLSKIVSKITKPIKKAIDTYLSIYTLFLSDLSYEIIFYIRSITFIKKLEDNGLQFCFPDVLPKDERECFIKNSFNINLAIIHDENEQETHSKKIVTNNIIFNESGRIHIVTGPNRGGKTVYTQAIGLNQILFQAGLMVPGSEARMSPVDTIFTHYQIEERPDLQTGRFGDEAYRLQEIFNKASKHSLILMNESLSSTSSGEGLYIAEDILLAFAIMGSRVVFATHLHEVAERANELNKQTNGLNSIISMVSQVNTIVTGDKIKYENTYKIIPGPPEGHSYARNIARKYGISYQQLVDLLKNRNVI